MATSYYEHKRAEGDAFAAFAAEQLTRFGYQVGLYLTQGEQYRIGESRMGLEIKLDDWLARSGNVYFEMYEKTRASNQRFIESGILRCDNTLLYGIGNRKEFFIFGKRTLQRVYEAFDRGMVPPPADKDFIRRATPTSKGFTLPRWLATAYAERLFRAKPDGQWFDPQGASWSFRVDDLRRALGAANRNRSMFGEVRLHE